MAYVIERSNRFYIAADDGIDPLTARTAYSTFGLGARRLRALDGGRRHHGHQRSLPVHHGQRRQSFDDRSASHVADCQASVPA